MRSVPPAVPPESIPDDDATNPGSRTRSVWLLQLVLGASVVITVLLVQALRAWVATRPDRTGPCWLDVLGDPVRRRLLDLLADGEAAAGALTEVIRAEFGISQPAVSQHLRVLRETGFAHVRADGTRRLYAADPDRLREADDWLRHLRP